MVDFTPGQCRVCFGCCFWTDSRRGRHSQRQTFAEVDIRRDRQSQMQTVFEAAPGTRKRQNRERDRYAQNIDSG